MYLRLIALISLSSLAISCEEECRRNIYKIQEAEYRLVPKSGYNVKFFLKAGDSIYITSKALEGNTIDLICFSSSIYLTKGIGRPIACSEDSYEVNWKFHIIEAGEYAVYIRNNSNEFKKYYLNTYYVRCE